LQARVADAEEVLVAVAIYVFQGMFLALEKPVASLLPTSVAIDGILARASIVTRQFLPIISMKKAAA